MQWPDDFPQMRDPRGRPCIFKLDDHSQSFAKHNGEWYELVGNWPPPFSAKKITDPCLLGKLNA